MAGASSVKTERRKTLGVVLIVVGTIWGLVFLYSVHAALPSNWFRLPLESEIGLQGLIPQRWEFFTRPPTETDTLVFVQTKEKGWKQIDLGPSLGDWLGFGRTGLGLLLEMGLLTDTDQEISTSACEDRVPACLDKASTAFGLHNTTPNPFFCGELGIAFVDPLPWDRARSASSDVLPSRVARLSVAC